MRDKGLSPLYYAGSHGNLNTSYQNRTDSLTWNLEINFLIGNISPAIYPEITSSKIRNIKAEINYSYLRFAKNIINENAKLMLGGMWKTQFANYKHNQFQNSSINNYFLNTLNLSGSLSYPLRKNERQYLLVLQTNLPLIAFIIRPSYAYIKPKGFLEHNRSNVQNIMNSIEVCPFNRFSGLSSYISIEYEIKNNNSLRIGYKWEYWSHQSSNILETATHGIIIQMVFNLRNSK